MQILLYQPVPVPLSWGRITEDDSGLPMDGMAVLAVLCVLSPENYTTFFCCLPVVFLLPGGFSCGDKMRNARANTEGNCCMQCLFLSVWHQICNTVTTEKENCSEKSIGY